jgi:hypothetical protein
MRKAVAIGIGLFLVFLIVRAPASLVGGLVGDAAPVKLLETSGTIWSGDADLLVEGRLIGRLIWSFRPVSLLTAKIGYDLELAGEGVNLIGRATAGTSTTDASVTGGVGAGFVNTWLAPYDIELAGDFRLADTALNLTGRQLEAVGGSLTWTGGRVVYVLSGKVFRATLPPMHAELGPGPSAVVFADGDPTPLLHAELKPDGFAKIGVTKYLTKLTGNPWPGGDPDHAIVLEVEEQVF